MQTPVALGGSAHLLHDVNTTYQSLSDTQRAELGVVLSAFRSFRGDLRAHIAYVTVPVTTGKRFYDVLAREGVFSREQLIEKRGAGFMYEEIIKPNIDESKLYVDQLTENEERLCIAPSVFEAKPLKWTDDAYMALWYRVIGEMAGKHRLMDGWAYSYGGLREVLFSLQLQFRILRRSNAKKIAEELGILNFLPEISHDKLIAELEAMWAIKIYDHTERELKLQDALIECVRVIRELNSRGFDTENFINAAWAIMVIPFYAPSFFEPYECVQTPEYGEASRELKELVTGIRERKVH